MWWRGSRWHWSRRFLLELMLSREVAGLSERLRVGGRGLCVPAVHRLCVCVVFGADRRCTGLSRGCTDRFVVTLVSSLPQGHIKGYISHQHQKLVVSKQNPFPPLSTVC